MRILEYNDSLRQQWDDYITRHEHGTPFHLTAWKRVIENTFGYRSHYFLAEEGGAIRGVLPLFLFSNRLIGRNLISTPFGDYGGICADNQLSHELLQRHACDFADKYKVGYLELRYRAAEESAGFFRKDLYVSFDCELDPSPENIMAALPKDTRRMIRKGQKNGLQAVNDPNQLQIAYELYASNVRQLGTPVFPASLFRNLLAEFRDAAEVLVVWKGTEAIASVLSLRFRNGIYPHYAGALPRSRELAANNFMYWELMKSAAERGIRHFDFGRSKTNTGAYHFKRQWNMRERQLAYQYYLVRRRTMPNFSPANPHFRMAIALWRRIPLPITKLVGPSLVKLFP